MSGRILSPIASIGVVATLLVSFGVPEGARADNCLTAPNSSAPQGSHWYYRTDRANQRKCWYVRSLGEPAQQAERAQATSEAAPAAQAHGTAPSAGAPMSISPIDVAPPSPHAKMLAVEPKRVPPVSNTNDKLGAQEGSTATSDESASNLPGAWPESPPAVGTVQTQESNAVPTDARADSADSKADTLASNDTESSAGSGEPTTNVGMPGSLRATPQVFLIIALGLLVVGILSRVVMTIAARRHARVVFNHPESDPVEDRGPDEWRDAHDEFGSVHEREADYPPVATASDCGPPRLIQTDSCYPDSPRDLNEVSMRDGTLSELRQELDRLLHRQRLRTGDDEQIRPSGQTQGEALRKALGLV